ncbi:MULTISPECIES: sigma-54-dependent transcriptional regulator [Halomonadaceae]|uniref:sigma-54-dependent transcriptional regulator n=1 Tax=Halomonadaceae TaxID=28256 RepID=UPI00110E071A|nr:MULTISPECIES: sigma-54 dependent transcriptional regulator [Halomonas]MCD1588117.1 sigma-54 dependent transcriptional regulator [Halomonas sp. IOP_14]QNU63244.1 sigma-54-dependent Fis family transcriptional regulator [Halomonas titanicae]TMU17690.1 sigma-54-dependent Fis family transcriptional regulator [Halomonas sp. ATBC28]CAD5248976.1 Transcriptional regulatory protein ZraR [Halomonas sp. I3]CAD5270345.1 Transcriptional regulatory protein ZraR [Halomonas sp. 113]|tara:strand:+ start:1416 stop:2810 length:1395 start_codon:yes stop_codon:yes gene_type:complete
MPRILIVEDEAIIRSALKRLLERHDYTVSEAGSAEEASQLELAGFDLIISDLRLPGEPGTSLITAAAPVPVLIMTSYASMRSAVEALKQGAVDYVAKPFDHAELLETVERILHKQSMQQSPPPDITDAGGSRQTMIGNCVAMQQVYTRISKTAPADVTVLILGESGTGKELVARAIHQQSKRAKAPLICVNCAAIPETLIESELFGHEKGAFTGASAARTGLVEAADGGTLFLDEIGELPLDAQARLLRVLQEGEIRKIGSVETRHVNVRLIAATHRDLRALSKTGEFRLDLYYRLNVMQIELPPLREREDDVLEIADILLDKACKRHERTGLRLSRAARQDLRDYPWPGNVRELENALERGVILAEGHLIHPDDLGLAPTTPRPHPSSGASSTPAASGGGDKSAEENEDDLSLEDYFQHFVLEHQDQMSETELAQKLGISRKNLWERRQRLGIPRKKTARRPG